MTTGEIEKGGLFHKLSPWERETHVTPPTRSWFGSKKDWEAHKRRHYYKCGFKGWGENWEPLWNGEGCRKESWAHSQLRLCDSCYEKHRREQKANSQWDRRHAVEILQDHFEKRKADLVEKESVRIFRTFKLHKIEFGYDTCPRCHAKNEYVENYPEPKKVTCFKCGLTVYIAAWNAWHATQGHIDTIRKAFERHRAELAETKLQRERDKAANRQYARKSRAKRAKARQ